MRPNVFAAGNNFLAKQKTKFFLDLEGITSPVADTVYELGMIFSVSKISTVIAVRFFKFSGESDANTYTARIWDGSGTLLTSQAYPSASISGAGWKEVGLTTPLSLLANTNYVVSVNKPTLNVGYAISQAFHTSQITRDIITVPIAAGVFNATPGSFPSTVFNNSTYFRDVVLSV